jgi:hypothetical protein
MRFKQSLGNRRGSDKKVGGSTWQEQCRPFLQERPLEMRDMEARRCYFSQLDGTWTTSVFSSLLTNIPTSASETTGVRSQYIGWSGYTEGLFLRVSQAGQPLHLLRLHFRLLHCVTAVKCGLWRWFEDQVEASTDHKVANTEPATVQTLQK